jgi:hypothetical protein
MSADCDRKIRQKHQKKLSEDEIFLTCFIELLEFAGDRLGASMVRERLHELKESKQLKEWIS